ncbi:MAG: DUF5683 domain-containing protein [candidate division WOR-3 bacterium]
MLLVLLVAQADWATNITAVRDTAANPRVVSLVVKRVPTGLDTVAYLTGKNPARAAWLSAIIPGAGQFYNGQAWKGLLLGGIEGFLAGMTATKLIEYRQDPSEETMSPALNYGFFFIGVWGFSVADAYAFAYMKDFARRASLVEKEVTPRLDTTGGSEK